MLGSGGWDGGVFGRAPAVVARAGFLAGCAAGSAVLVAHYDGLVPGQGIGFGQCGWVIQGTKDLEAGNQLVMAAFVDLDARSGNVLEMMKVMMMTMLSLMFQCWWDSTYSIYIFSRQVLRTENIETA